MGDVLGEGDVADVVQRLDAPVATDVVGQAGGAGLEVGEAGERIHRHGSPASAAQAPSAASDAKRLGGVREAQPGDGGDLEAADLAAAMHPGMGLSNTWQIPAISYIEHCQIGGCWIRVGPQIESWIGYTAEQSSVPNFWKTCLHPDDKDRVLAEDERCERTLEPWGNTYRFIARDGRTSSRSRPTTPGSRPWSPRSPSTASPDGSWAARPLSRSASSGPSSGIPSRTTPPGALVHPDGPRAAFQPQGQGPGGHRQDRQRLQQDL